MTSLYLTAARSFEAARETRAGMHGHGFRARAVAEAGSIEGGFPGGECDALAERLARAVAPLDYALANERLATVGDESIAEWLLDRLDLQGASALALRSAPERGAIAKGDGERLAWQAFRFEAAHRLPHVPAGHKCGRMHGHGFVASVDAAPAPGESARAAQERIAQAWQPLQSQLHLGCLNDLPGLDNPTSEVLAGWAWSRLEEGLDGLCGITVMETPTAGCHFDGSGYRIWKAMTFDSAVRLSRAPASDCRRLLHGHTYTARLHVAGGLDQVLGWVHDFGDVKRQFDPVFRALDHQPLHEHAGLADNDPASIAELIEAGLAAGLPGLSRVDVESTPGCGAIRLRGDDPRGLLVP